MPRARQRAWLAPDRTTGTKMTRRRRHGHDRRTSMVTASYGNGSEWEREGNAAVAHINARGRLWKPKKVRVAQIERWHAVAVVKAGDRFRRLNAVQLPPIIVDEVDVEDAAPGHPREARERSGARQRRRHGGAALGDDGFEGRGASGGRNGDARLREGTTSFLSTLKFSVASRCR